MPVFLKEFWWSSGVPIESEREFELANSGMTGRLKAANDGKMLGSRAEFWANHAKSCTQYAPYFIILPLALLWRGNRFFIESRKGPKDTNWANSLFF